MPVPPNKRTDHANEQLKQGEDTLKTPWREGEVVDVDAPKAKVKVEFSDQESADGSSFVSPWLRVGQRGTFGALAYWVPKVGEQVVCLLDANQEDGVVICSTYSEPDPPPKDVNTKYYYEWPDGSSVMFDEISGNLYVDMKGFVQFQVGDNVRILNPNESTINGKNINVLGAVDNDDETSGPDQIVDDNQLPFPGYQPSDPEY